MSIRALKTAATGMHAHEVLTEVISNNLANISTTAFKKRQAAFEDLLYQNESRVGATTAAGTVIPTGVQVGLGSKLAAVYSINNQGELQQTYDMYHVAIEGRGYLRVELPGGDTGYTRDGSLRPGPDGVLVTKDGHVVQPPIQIPLEAKAITITDDGIIYAQMPGAPVTLQNLGQLEIILFQNDSGLKALGNNLLAETESSGAPEGDIPGANGRGTLLQGWLENSNVNPIVEITSLIVAQRGYELCSKVIQAGDEMMQTANNSKR